MKKIKNKEEEKQVANNENLYLLKVSLIEETY